MRLPLFAAGLLVVASATPAMSQDTDEAWCAGLVEYLGAEADALLSVEAVERVLSGCIAYRRVTDDPATDAAVGDPGPVILTDAARIWCSEHDFNANRGGADHDDYDLVAEAATSLDIPVPGPLLDYNNAFWFASHTDWAELIPEDIVSAYFDWDLDGGRAAWRESDGYARACMAAYELGRPR
jgi:hypothetical protein